MSFPGFNGKLKKKHIEFENSIDMQKIVSHFVAKDSID